MSDLGFSLSDPTRGPFMATRLAAQWGKLPLSVHPIDVDIQLRDAAALLRITSLPRFLPSCVLSALPANGSPHPGDLTRISMQYNMGMRPEWGLLQRTIWAPISSM